MTDIYKLHAQLIRDLTTVVARSPSRLLNAWPSALAELAPAIPHKIHGTADAHDLRRVSDDMRLVGRVAINLLIMGADEINDMAPMGAFDVPRFKSDLSDLAQCICKMACDLDAEAVKLETRSQRNKTLRFIDTPSITDT
jgi:hypothetical protein